MNKTIEQRLTGGHPNSLGETVAVTEDVLSDTSAGLFDELCKTYESNDEVVRLRVSSALKRVCGLHRDSLQPSAVPRPDWVLSRFDWLLKEIGWVLTQPSAKWSIAQISVALDEHLSDTQRENAIALLKHNLVNEQDWIVQNTTADALAHFVQLYDNKSLCKWLLPKLDVMAKDSRKSVAARGEKLRQTLSS